MALLSATGRPDDGAVGGVGRAAGLTGRLRRTGRIGRRDGSFGAVPSGQAATPQASRNRRACPPSTAPALTRRILVNQHLAAARATLRTNLAASPFDAVGVAQTLGRLSQHRVRHPDGLDRRRLVTGRGARAQALAKQYDAIHEAASQALVNSVRVEAAYGQSAKTMVALLAKLAPVDAGARALATANAVVLPAGSAAP